MLYPISILSIVLLALIHLSNGQSEHVHSSIGIQPGTITLETRAYWMRRAISALSELESPCHFQAFGTVIVNHTDTSSDPKGELVCMGVNQNMKTGNPTLHGEIAAINNCSEIFTDQNGPHNFSPMELLQAWSDLSLYTTAEACPMCASAIRWSGFAEYIYATTIDTLVEKGFSQISISSQKVFDESSKLQEQQEQTLLLGNILENETDPLFSWQFDGSYPCPIGCRRSGDHNRCEEIKDRREQEL